MDPPMYVPLHWLHRPQLARKATPKMELKCCLSQDPEALPQFQRRCTMVNVLQVIEAKPFALVRRVGSTDRPRYVPLHWLDRPELARKATPKIQLECTISQHPEALPQYQRWVTMVYVLQVIEGQTQDMVQNKSPPSPLANNSSIDNKKYEVDLLLELKNAMDDSSQTRTNALQAIVKILSNQYMPELVEHHKDTFIEIVKNAIRYGKDAEPTIGVQILPLLILHLGEDEDIISTLVPLFLRTILDASMSADVRAKCCSSLALAYFLYCKDESDLLQFMQQLEKLFSTSNTKEEQSESTSDEVILQSSALRSWALLLTSITPSNFNQVTKSSMSILTCLLQSSHVELRNNAGEVIALILECKESNDERIPKENLSDLIELMKQLATDSNKFRAKRDRKAQRSTFRQILHYIEDGTTHEVSIRFGEEETICLNTWANHTQYRALCDIIGSGTKTHLAENDFLRKIFELKDKSQKPHPFLLFRQQYERRQRDSMNEIARSVSRRNQREERSNFKSSILEECEY